MVRARKSLGRGKWTGWIGRSFKRNSGGGLTERGVPIYRVRSVRTNRALQNNSCNHLHFRNKSIKKNLRESTTLRDYARERRARKPGRESDPFEGSRIQDLWRYQTSTTTQYFAGQDDSLQDDKIRREVVKMVCPVSCVTLAWPKTARCGIHTSKDGGSAILSSLLKYNCAKCIRF